MKKTPRVSTFYEEYDRGRHALWMLWQHDKKAWETWSRAWRYGVVPCVCHGYGKPQDETGLPREAPLTPKSSLDNVS